MPPSGFCCSDPTPVRPRIVAPWSPEPACYDKPARAWEFGMKPGFRSNRGVNQIQPPLYAVQAVADRVSANFKRGEANFEAGKSGL